MASYFGEVIHPSSRAFWNDADDDEIVDSSLENLDFVVKWLEDEPLSFDKLLVIEGEMMTDFVTKNLFESNTRCICTISCESDKNCTKIYAFKDLYVCIIDRKHNLTHSGQLCLTMVPLFEKTKHIVLLLAEHVSHFKSKEDNSSFFLKSLCSQKAKVDQNLKTTPLNQPNIISGVCAGVLSYAEIADLYCVMYILYTDTFVLDSENSTPITKLFMELFGKSVSKFSAKESICFNKGNLYM